MDTIKVYCRECDEMTEVPLPEKLGQDRYYDLCKKCNHEVFFRESDVIKALGGSE